MELIATFVIIQRPTWVWHVCFLCGHNESSVLWCKWHTQTVELIATFVIIQWPTWVWHARFLCGHNQSVVLWCECDANSYICYYTTTHLSLACMFPVWPQWELGPVMRVTHSDRWDSRPAPADFSQWSGDEQGGHRWRTCWTCQHKTRSKKSDQTEVEIFAHLQILYIRSNRLLNCI